MTTAPAGIALETLPPPARAILALVGALADSRRERVAWVGGGVRDHLLGRAGLDLDFVLEGEIEPFSRALAERLGARQSFHSRFLSATLGLPGGIRLDVVRARRERYPSPAALPEVEAASLREDLARRDFAINAIAVRLAPIARQGEILDPQRGCADLAAGRLRVLHAQSFDDDPTRLLRGLRFALRFGFRFDPETDTQARAAAASGRLDAVSGTRLARELRLLFDDRPEVEAAIAGLANLGLLAGIAPELSRAATAERAAHGAGALRAVAARLAPEVEVTGWRLGLLALARTLEPVARRRLAARLALDSADRKLVDRRARARRRGRRSAPIRAPTPRGRSAAGAARGGGADTGGQRRWGASKPGCTATTRS